MFQNTSILLVESLTFLIYAHYQLYEPGPHVASPSNQPYSINKAQAAPANLNILNLNPCYKNIRSFGFFEWLSFNEKAKFTGHVRLMFEHLGLWRNGDPPDMRITNFIAISRDGSNFQGLFAWANCVFAFGDPLTDSILQNCTRSKL